MKRPPCPARPWHSRKSPQLQEHRTRKAFRRRLRRHHRAPSLRPRLLSATRIRDQLRASLEPEMKTPCHRNYRVSSMVSQILHLGSAEPSKLSSKELTCRSERSCSSGVVSFEISYVSNGVHHERFLHHRRDRRRSLCCRLFRAARLNTRCEPKVKIEGMQR